MQFCKLWHGLLDAWTCASQDTIIQNLPVMLKTPNFQSAMLQGDCIHGCFCNISIARSIHTLKVNCLVSCACLCHWHVQSDVDSKSCAGRPQLASGCPHALGVWTVLLLVYHDIVGELDASLVEAAEFQKLPLDHACHACPSVRERLVIDGQSKRDAFLSALRCDDLQDLTSSMRSQMESFNSATKDVFQKTYQRLTAPEKQTSMHFSWSHHAAWSTNGSNHAMPLQFMCKICQHVQ